MRKRNFRLLPLFFIGLLFVFHFSSPLAQAAYPTRPIELIIPWAPGSITDIAARFFAEKWTEFMGQPVVPVNKVGGAGTIGCKLVANAKPDGYTLLFPSTGPLITSRIGRKDIGYDLDSFRYIFSLAKSPTSFSVKTEAKWKTMSEFLLDAKQNPGKLKWCAVMGSTPHYGIEMLVEAAKVKLNFVPFKSSPEGLTAVLGGHIDMLVTTGQTRTPLIRLLAVAEEKRLFNLADVPTLKEIGYPIFVDTKVTLCGPQDIPEEVINKFLEVNRKVFEKYEKGINEKLPELNLYPNLIDGNLAMKMYKEEEKSYLKTGIKVE